MPNLNQQCEVVAGRAAPSQQSLDLGVQGDCGEVAVVANAMFNEQARPLEHYMLNAICIQHDDVYAGLKFSFVCQQVSFWVAQWLCWERIVEKWFTPEWEEKHNAGREWRLLMPDPAHHQGSLCNEEYMARWAHGSAECPEFVGWALAHKGKASEVTYNPDDPPSVYNNPSVYTRINAYTEARRQVHGPECDPSTHPLDGEIIMRVGGGKKHGRYYIGDDTLDTTSSSMEHEQ
ncbi:uncharacterized protein C2845_PM11G25730 [Panicum miliaceum]|uniref:Uncharacterized protein n=1 Tax=Panicum miliaceum TaxID=4540 RepID=A0A3L6RUI0_PANMI|nr:uncharacterized protein C2845_PM11G25730 [Panicum miliaceum]